MDERRQDRGVLRSLRYVLSAPALVAVLMGSLVTAGDPASASSTGLGDQRIWYGGGDVGLPSGYVRVYFENVGTEPLVGRTTVLAEVGTGPLRFTYAALFPPGGPGTGDSISGVGPDISADGRRLTFSLDGTNLPGVTRELRVYFTGNRIMPPIGPSSYRLTFTHPDDANPANDSLAFGPSPPPPPTTVSTTATVTS
jgi:hypothetical protein